MQKYDFSTSVFTFTIPSTPCSVKWCLRNAPLHPESNKMLLEWKEHQQNSLCSPFSLQFFLLLAVTAVQKKGHLISNRNEERLSLCVLVHKCVCVCVCSHAHAHALGWDGGHPMRSAQKLFTVLSLSSDAHKIFSRLEGTSLEGAKPQMDRLGTKYSVISS